jgi:hypothetical protein
VISPSGARGWSARLEAEGATPFIVRGNRGDLQQAILNLIINAEQSLTGTGGAIVVRLSHDGDVVSLSGDRRGCRRGADATRSARFRRLSPRASRSSLRDSDSGPRASSSSSHGGTLKLEPSSNGAIFTIRLETTGIRNQESGIRNQESGIGLGQAIGR